MIKSLYIKNFSIINEMKVDLSEGFNIITGESGSGKSLLLKALNLLLGGRFEAEQHKMRDKSIILEAVIDQASSIAPALEQLNIILENNEILLRREITPNNKSRVFVNDNLVKISDIKNIFPQLIDIHSQNENMLLQNDDFYLQIIDKYADNEKIKNIFRTNYIEYNRLNTQKKALLEQKNHNEQKQDYNSFLLNEFKGIEFDDIEQQELESEAALLRNAENIKTTLNEAGSVLDFQQYSILSQIEKAINLLEELSDINPRYQEIYNRLESSKIELRDILTEIHSENRNLEINPSKLAQIEDKLNIIYKLQKKHNVSTIAELINIKKALEDTLNQTEEIDHQLEEIEKRLVEKKQVLEKNADQLTKSRSMVGAELEGQLIKYLNNLDIKEAKIKITISKKEIGENGQDQVDILFGANKGHEPASLRRVASGGELSRLMFCIRYILANNSKLSVQIFDEIDTGISGEAAYQMAQMMIRMAERYQILTITHIPQIAAKGKHHYLIYKTTEENKSRSSIIKLSKEQRIEEIAKMISGSKTSDITLRNAEEMIIK